MVVVVVSQDPCSPWEVLSPLRAILKVRLSHLRRWGHRAGVEEERLHLGLARLGFPLNLRDFSSALPANLLSPYIATLVVARTQKEPSPLRTWGGRWRGCGGRCGSRCDRGRSSTNAKLPSRCSEMQLSVQLLRDTSHSSIGHRPGLRSRPQWSRLGKPRRRLSAWCSLALPADDLNRAL